MLEFGTRSMKICNLNSWKITRLHEIILISILSRSCRFAIFNKSFRLLEALSRSTSFDVEIPRCSLSFPRHCVYVFLRTNVVTVPICNTGSYQILLDITIFSHPASIKAKCHFPRILLLAFCIATFNKRRIILILLSYLFYLLQRLISIWCAIDLIWSRILCFINNILLENLSAFWILVILCV